MNHSHKFLYLVCCLIVSGCFTIGLFKSSGAMTPKYAEVAVTARQRTQTSGSIRGAVWELIPARSSGNFAMTGLPDGRYRLEIFGYLPQPAHPYPDYHEYYRNAATLDRATDIVVTGGVTVADLAVELGDDPNAVLINGPTAANVGMDYTFSAVVSPAYAGLPITYTWYPNDPAMDEVVTHSNGITDSVVLRWSTPGLKSVRVVADNGQRRVESNRYQVAVDSTVGVQIETVQVLGGDLQAITGNGAYLYRGVGSKLAVVDVSSPNNPLLVGESQPLPDTLADLTYAAGSLYVAAGRAGVRVFDVTLPQKPREIGQYTGIMAAAQIALRDQYAFVLDGREGLVILNVANPAQPTLVGSFAQYSGTEIAIDGQLALIVAADIALVDISNPAAPLLVSRYQPGKIGTMALVDGYLYLSDQLTTCRIVSLQNPQAPTEVGSCGNPWQEMKIYGRTLYTTGFHTNEEYQGGVWVYDLANPAAPVFVTRYVEAAGQLSNLYVTASTVVASSLTDGLIVIAVANQPQPYVAGSLSSLSGIGGVMALQGDYAYLFDQSFHVLDLTQPNRPTEIARLPLLVWSYQNRQVAVRGNNALVTYGDQLQLIDLTNPKQPKLRGRYAATSLIDAMGMTDSYVYLLVDQHNLLVIDIHNPDTLALVGKLNVNTPARLLTVQGEYAYLGGNDALQIVQLTNPLTPILIANLPKVKYLDAIRVEGGRLYTLERAQLWSNSTRSFKIYDLTNPVLPTLLGQYGPDLFQSMLVDQYRAYLSTVQNQFYVLDIGDPAMPFLLGRTSVSGARTLALRLPYLYAASDTMGIAVLWLRTAQKLSTPTNQPFTFAPTNVIQYEFPANSWQLNSGQAVPAAVKVIHTQAYPRAITPVIGERTLVGHPYQVQVVDAGSGQPVSIVKPYLVQTQYDPATMDEATLTIFYQVQGEWRAAEQVTVDTNQKLLRATLPQLTTWALFATPRPDTTGQQSFLPIIARAAFDARIANVELTQATQTLKNDVPLVAGRPLVARIYAVTDNATAINGCQLVLTATRNGAPLPGSPLTVGPWAIFPQPLRDKLSNTFNVLLPLSWTQGNVRLTAQLYLPAGQQDRTPANNQTTLDLTFHAVPPLDIKIVPIHYTHQPTGKRYPAPTDEQFSDYVMRLYPVHALQLSMRTPIEFTGDLSSDKGWSTLLQLVGTVKKGDNAPSAQIYYGLLPTGDFQPKWGGMGSSARFSASFNNGGVVAHELGHNLGRQHAPCGNPGGVDPAYPYAKASIGEYGFDLTGFTILHPATTADVMSYCGPDWVSDYTYRGLFTNQRTAGLPSAGLAAAPGILVRADLTDARDVVFQPLYFYAGDLSPLPAASAVTVRFLAEDGALLAEHPVALESAEEGGFVTRFVSALLPQPDQPVARVQLRTQGQVIAERSLLTDTVQAATTYQLVQSEAELTLRWQPSAQPALVRYTNDNGQSWLTLAVDATGGELHFAPGSLPGGAGRFAILPADLPQPVLAADASPTITLPDQAPKAWITGPTTVQPGAPLLLFGYGDDPEDGALANLQWTVNGQPVAAGHTLQVETTAGLDPIVTLTVTDSAGQSFTAIHRVTVER
ncbi:MAG: hypothetical protein DYG89_23090 [Caldilinea sp. CFX5]|nr:hypothetical protein [Caldilinea sp. CFX5]